MQETLVPQSVYSNIRNTTTVDEQVSDHSPERRLIYRLHSSFIPALSDAARVILEHVVQIMADLSAFESSTKMSPLALAIVVVPTLINGDDPVEDAEMCLSPGKSLPPGLRKAHEGEDDDAGKGGTLVGVLKMWIEELAGSGKSG